MYRGLAPSDFVGIIGDAFTIYKNNYLKFFGIVAALYFPLIVLIIGVILVVMLPTSPLALNPDSSELYLVYAMIPAGSITLFVALIAATLAQGALVHATAEQYFLRPVGIGRAFRFAWHRIWNMMGALILPGLAILGIWLLIFGIPLAIYFSKIIPAADWQLILLGVFIAIPGLPAAIYLGIIWAFSLQAALFEGCGPTAALSRSAALVKGSWWRVLGIFLLLQLILMGINFVARIIPFVGGLISMFVSLPIGAIGLTLIYFDQRVRKEGYNLDNLSYELGLTAAPTDAVATPQV